MAQQHQYLGFWDYIVLGLSLLISLSIGVYFRFSGGKQKTTKEYLLGDRNQKVLPVALSLMASFMSAVTLLGVSAEVYMFGTMFLTIIASYILFTAVAAHLYLPVFFKLQATSAYEYLERRFGAKTRVSASLLYSVQMLLYTGVVLYAPALALEALTGLSRNFSILCVGLVCTLYSTVGGIKAVIWTDFFQSLLMYAALVSVISTAVIRHGGLAPIWKIAQDHQRIQFYDLSLDPTVRHSTWSLFLGGGLTFLSLYAVNQTQVQRYLTMKDYKSAARTLWLSLPFLYLLLVACGLAGLAIFSVYYTCDPLKSGRITQVDQLMPLFVMDTMASTPGLSGLFAAGIFSASLSTVSACVNSLAAVTVEDYLKPLYQGVSSKQASKPGGTQVVKLVALVYGLACVGVAYLAQHLGGLLQAGLSVLGIAGGPLLATFTLGMFFPQANQPGALAGMASGLVSALWLSFGQPKPRPAPLPVSTAGCASFFNQTITNSALMPTVPPPVEFPYLYRVSYLWYIVISCLLTLVVGLIVSRLAAAFGHKPSQPFNPDLFSPPVASYLRRNQASYDVALQESFLKTETSKATEDKVEI